jgi:cystathionine beta-lyase
LRTLSVRLERHERTGIELARWLQARPEVERVLHPALPEHPAHGLWKRDFAGATGLFSIVLKPCTPKALEAMLDGMALFGMGYSWGGYESLVIPFDPARARTQTSWPPPLWHPADKLGIRLSIGLEDPADLLADLERGFTAMAQG